MTPVLTKVEKWKQKLLDLSKRNRLLNYRETKRSNISIVKPDIKTIFDSIVNKGKELEFALIDDKINLFNYDDIDKDSSKINIEDINLKDGEILTNRSDSEMLKTLASIRAKAKTAMEEQGVNILYLAFGYLEWTEAEFSNTLLKSPILLVPVQLKIESMLDPYKLSMSDDDILVNPTLIFKMERDFNITLPELEDYEIDVIGYLNKVEAIVSANGWKVGKEVYLSLFSFLKLNMYEDLDKNSDKVTGHYIIKALAGDKSELKPVPEELTGLYDHDSKTRPIDTFQVVDADASQQDAIVSAKRGVSFVLQGPPGTGKSQTITNIIAECLAEGKKVLFVSQKMAALEVVYKRLDEAGLTDFCLQLHSHKANKKDVLSELGRTLNISRTQTKKEAIAELEQLLEDRTRLNDYVKSLHTPCQPLGKSLYEVHGTLLKYQYEPDLAFDLENVDKYTQSDINKFRRLLEQFARTANKLGSDYLSNPWYGCTVKTFTLELQHNIIMNFNSLRKRLEELKEACDRLDSILQLKPHQTLEQAKKLKELLEIAGKSTKPLVSWVKSQQIELLKKKAKGFLEITEKYKSTKSDIFSKYTDEILKIEAYTIKRQLNKNFSELLNSFLPERIKNEDDIITKRDWLTEVLDKVIWNIDGLRAISSNVASKLGIDSPYDINQAKSLSNLLGNMLKDPKPLESWFDDRQFVAVCRAYGEARTKYENKLKYENIIKREFDKDILKLDSTPMLIRFRTSYKSVLKYFKPKYYKDKKAFRIFAKDTSRKLEDKDIVNYLQLLKEIEEINEWISNNRSKLREYLGSWFNDEYTEWNAVSNAIDSFKKIMGFFTHKEVPEKTKSLLLNSALLIDTVKVYHSQLLNLLEDIEIINTAKSLIKLDTAIESFSINILYDKIFSLKNILNTSLSLYDSVAKCVKPGLNITFKSVMDDLDKVSLLQKTQNLVAEQSMDLEKLFGHYFKGIETNWTDVLTSLEWTSTFESTIEDLDVSDKFVELICCDEGAINTALEGSKEISDLLSKIKPEFDYLKSLFNEDVNNFERRVITALCDWINKCKDNFRALEEWIDFKQSREQCIKEGLGDFIKKVIEKKIPSKHIVGTFFKRFYRLWLDVMYKHFPAVSEFRRRNHEVLIDDFKELDKKQLVIARARVREKLSSKLPSIGSITSGRGEIDILRRELGKRRRIMPLRKLFRSIPNLLMALKPCLMMSPLSVSLFLDPKYYKFDVVIFDEASQVCPEDAIGAIYRADQVIVAGDSEQLPPTNFFNVSTGESDYDEDNEDDDVEAFESILDEMKSFLPEKSLKWHYRSKHEHLITFSNIKIYSKRNNSLITFPSCIERVADNGVEYIYVPEGIYDRSGTRTNKIEAKKVAELVFKHFKQYPNRSLGVVTFSEAQRNEIESALRHMRKNHPQFEKFFDESNEEAFFIKNLENVQGDERDTIIFSIGYAKDQNNVMHMNFGPLSKSGGYRRLNVAITRAKYNVKLVGSIKPTDIDLERTSSDGVKMLRSYIEFAIHGPDAILNETVEPEKVYTESPFEDEIYKFLRDKGYNVATQVGCSGYRIDLAIKHPKKSGKYVIGIECDGATYHSARTARERDRLRDDVLRNRGWKLYRIWSTDWIKDPVSEGKRLLTAIEEAMNCDEDIYEASLELQQNSIDKSEVLNSVSVELQDSDNHTNLNENAYGFSEYQVADFTSFTRRMDESYEQYLARVIKHVIVVEGPIHFELLCKRLAPLFGREKATAPVRRTVEYILKNKLDYCIKIVDDFCWNKNYKEIEVRSSFDGNNRRKIEYICKEELAEAMFKIVKCHFGISFNDLFVETARVFGYNRAGEKIQRAMQKALNYLLDSGRVKDEDGKISVNV